MPEFLEFAYTADGVIANDRDARPLLRFRLDPVRIGRTATIADGERQNRV
jgi:hypothetical protein